MLKVRQKLDKAGVEIGDRVATIAWNTGRHLECWYGVMGISAICHTVNPRLFPEQIAWIVNHAQDKVVIADFTFVPILEKLADSAHMPLTTLNGQMAISNGRPSTKMPPPRCATRRAPQAIPRAGSIRTALTCCTR
jgi:fatty-acyl-CoA synthase